MADVPLGAFLSGGIDSALTLCIAVDALGADLGVEVGPDRAVFSLSVTKDKLDIRRAEAAWACPACAAPIPAGAVLRCAACDVPARLTSGDEILLEQIEMEVP